MSKTFKFDAKNDPKAPKKDANLPDFSVADPKTNPVDTITWTSTTSFIQVQIYTKTGQITELASAGPPWTAQHTFDNSPGHPSDEAPVTYTQLLEVEAMAPRKKEKEGNDDDQGGSPQTPPPNTVIVVTSGM